jgi:hypothetical protein
LPRRPVIETPTRRQSNADIDILYREGGARVFFPGLRTDVSIAAPCARTKVAGPPLSRCQSLLSPALTDVKVPEGGVDTPRLLGQQARVPLVRAAHAKLEPALTELKVPVGGAAA